MTFRARLSLPDALRKNLPQQLAAIKAVREQVAIGAGPSDYRFISDAIFELHEAVCDDLAMMKKSASAALPKELADILPAKGDSQAEFAATFFLLGFPVKERPTLGLLDSLILIFQNAIAGNSHLMAKPEPPSVYYPPRVFTRRWLREGAAKLFSAVRRLVCVARPDTAARTNEDVVIGEPRSVPAAPLSTVPTAPQPDAPRRVCQCEICNPS